MRSQSPAAKAISNRASEVSRASWSSWAKQALKAGAGAAHSFVKRGDKEPVLVDRPSVFQEVSAECGKWSKHWRATTAKAAEVLSPALPASEWALRTIGWGTCSGFAEQVSPAAIAVAAKRFREGTSSASDSLHCRHYSMLPPPVLATAAALMQVTLATGYAPSVAGLVAVALIPKSGGVSLRPIGVVSALHRVLGAVVKPTAKAWGATLAQESSIFCAGAFKRQLMSSGVSQSVPRSSRLGLIRPQCPPALWAG